MEPQRTQEMPSPPFLADLGRSFFQSWTLRSSDHVHPVGTSECSTPISPLNILGHRNAKRSAGPSRQSEISQFFMDISDDEATFPPFRRLLPSTISKDPPLLEGTRLSAVGVQDLNNSQRSSISNRVRKLLPRSKYRSSSSSIVYTEPLSDARLDQKLKQDTSGHWTERRKRSKQSDSKMDTGSEDAFREIAKPSGIIDTLRASGTSPKGDLELSQKDDPLGTITRPASGQTEGFYTRAKRRLRLSQESCASPQGNIRVKTFTAEILERVTRTLHELTDRQSTVANSSTTSSTMSSRSIAGSYTRRARLLLYGNSNKYSDSQMFGVDHTGHQQPRPSPELLATYTGSDSRQYFCVDITAPDGPTYLPSEARRITTPPLLGPEFGRAMPGFFLEHNSQTIPIMKPNFEPVNGSLLARRQQREARSSTTDWYKVQATALETTNAQQRHRFELNVPDHLPNSPLCPKNPKHSSGGKGVCIYHVRNKTMLPNE